MKTNMNQLKRPEIIFKVTLIVVFAVFNLLTVQANNYFNLGSQATPRVITGVVTDNVGTPLIGATGIGQRDR